MKFFLTSSENTETVKQNFKANYMKLKQLLNNNQYKYDRSTNDKLRNNIYNWYNNGLIYSI